MEGKHPNRKRDKYNPYYIYEKDGQGENRQQGIMILLFSHQVEQDGNISDIVATVEVARGDPRRSEITRGADKE